MITSTQNPKIKLVRALQGSAKTRKKENAFVVEGIRLVEEVFQSEFIPLFGLYTPDLNERGAQVVSAFEERGILMEEVSPQVFSSASETKTPQGILLTLPIKTLALPQKMDFILILDEIRDPGNLGTILRTAAAANAQAVLLTPGSVDVYTPKVVRSTMGAIFRLPVYNLGWGEIQRICRKNTMKVYLAAMNAGESLYALNMKEPLAIVIGGEANGAGDDALSLADNMVHIPMPGMAESLNAAVAAAILSFEVVRQRTDA